MQRLLCAVCLFVPLFEPLAVAQKKIVTPEAFNRPGQDAPLFSPGILDGGTLYVSGQIGSDLKKKEKKPRKEAAEESPEVKDAKEEKEAVAAG